jgi:hypothetical protein
MLSRKMPVWQYQKQKWGLTVIVAVADCAKNLNHTSEPVVPLAQAGAVPHASIAVVGSHPLVLHNEVPPAGQPTS